MKKIYFLIITMCLLLVGCENKEVNNKKIETPTTVIEESTQETKGSNSTTKINTGIYLKDNSNIDNIDIVVGDNYFDTQLADWNLNIDKYKGKTVEIEGFNLKNGPYSFIGRYSTSALCQYCPTGYSYFEYEWNGDEKFNPDNLENESTWMKIIGTIEVGNDESGDYYYIDAKSIEIMDEWGVSEVNN